MRIAIVTPDDLSTLIFCKPFALRLAGHPSVTVYSVSSVDLYRAEITALPTIHVEIPMARFLSLAEDWSYFWRLRQIFAENRIDVAILFTTKPNIYGALAARAAGVKTVAIAVRGLGSAFLADSRPKVRLLKAITTTLYRRPAPRPTGSGSQTAMIANISSRERSSRNRRRSSPATPST